MELKFQFLVSTDEIQATERSFSLHGRAEPIRYPIEHQHLP